MDKKGGDSFSSSNSHAIQFCESLAGVPAALFPSPLKPEHPEVDVGIMIQAEPRSVEQQRRHVKAHSQTWLHFQHIWKRNASDSFLISCLFSSSSFSSCTNVLMWSCSCCLKRFLNFSASLTQPSHHLLPCCCCFRAWQRGILFQVPAGLRCHHDPAGLRLIS